MKFNMPKAILFFLLALVICMLLFFLPAGSLNYWQAWVAICILFIPAFFVVLYFLKHNPEFLERRMRFKEKRESQKKIIGVSQILFYIGILVPGFDFRFGWSSVPLWLIILSDIIIFLSYILIFFVFRENHYASRIIEVAKGQKVVSTGPYSVVRHPMYAGAILMYLFFPLALGSFYALLFFVPVIPVLLFRIFDEEKLLLKSLKGYKEYCKKVKYRLIPGVW